MGQLHKIYCLPKDIHLEEDAVYLKISIVSHPKTTLPEFCGGLPDFGQNYLILRDINWDITRKFP